MGASLRMHRWYDAWSKALSCIMTLPASFCTRSSKTAGGGPRLAYNSQVLGRL